MLDACFVMATWLEYTLLFKAVIEQYLSVCHLENESVFRIVLSKIEIISNSTLEIG
jgi:hypothetical protein